MIQMIRPHSKTLFFLILFIIIISSCGGGGSSSDSANLERLDISVSGLKASSLSYEPQQITVTSNIPDCLFQLSQASSTTPQQKLLHVSSGNSKSFSFRNPIIYDENLDVQFDVTSIPSASCPSGSSSQQISVGKYPTAFEAVPENIADLSTTSFQANDIGFGGIVITDRFSSTICYPTPNDCQSYTNELFGQDAHNMAYGDFNGDGYEDFVVVWALFPHTLESSQKVDAPINIYINDGTGRFAEDLDLYATGSPPKHPFAYRALAKDFNGDGVDDLFAGSMGLQVRGEDYSQNYIDPFPHLLLLSNASGKLEESSANISDDNDGKGMLCNFAHDASSGDPDGDGDFDIFACNVLLINDGSGNFTIHPYINLNWQSSNRYGNPMSSLVVDLNNDGFDELIFWNFDNRAPWSDADEGYILMSNETANIEAWNKITLPTGPFGEQHNKYNHAASGDFNNDGFMDVVVAITRDLPYYEGAYLQVLINDGTGKLTDETSLRFSEQIRTDTHHGEGNVYVRDMNLDGHLDIIHSTRDYQSGHHGAHIALNDGLGNFTSVRNSVLPLRPVRSSSTNYRYLMKGLPINADNEACLDLISVTDVGWGDWREDTRNYLYSLINKDCNY